MKSAKVNNTNDKSKISRARKLSMIKIDLLNEKYDFWINFATKELFCADSLT
jgi:hypothetical protein